MYVGLAFAVAAHLENEILIVDEVLAVGDAEFQKKCLNKMDEISSKNGRTIILVSHILPSIKSLCTRAILLENGKLAFDGSVNHTIDRYLNNFKNTESFNPDYETIVLKKVVIKNQESETNTLEFGDDLKVELFFSAKRKILDPSFWITIHSDFGPVYGANALIDGLKPESVDGDFKLEYTFENLKLLPQEYTIYFGARDCDLYSNLMSSVIIGRFNMITSLGELGFKNVSDSFISTADPLLRSYTLRVNDCQDFVLDINKINLIK